nr:sigma-70 family RNA polymerase sigma factor [Bacteroidales bacterium]
MATDFNAYSDMQLVELYKQYGEGKYVGALYKRHIKMVLLICYKYLKNKDIAKEAVMQVFENLI